MVSSDFAASAAVVAGLAVLPKLKVEGAADAAPEVPDFKPAKGSADDVGLSELEGPASSCSTSTFHCSILLMCF